MDLKRNTRLRCEGFANHEVWVTRVAKDGTWVDVFVRAKNGFESWSKRMPLPLADVWSVESEMT